MSRESSALTDTYFGTNRVCYFCLLRLELSADTVVLSIFTSEYTCLFQSLCLFAILDLYTVGYFLPE